MFSASPSFSDTSYYYTIRYSVKNVLLIGLWYGVKKPKINSFWKHFFAKLECWRLKVNIPKVVFGSTLFCS